MEEISRDLANFWIAENHYSGTVVGNAKVHLAVMRGDREIVGALQYGYAMNPDDGVRVVAVECVIPTFFDLITLLSNGDCELTEEA